VVEQSTAVSSDSSIDRSPVQSRFAPNFRRPGGRLFILWNFQISEREYVRLTIALRPLDPSSLAVLMDSQGLDIQSLLDEAVQLIQDCIPEALQKPRVAIVCGSGLSTLGATIRGRVDLPYTSIPGFTSSTGVYRVSSRLDSNSYSGSGRPRECLSIWISWYHSRRSSSSNARTGTSLLTRSIALGNGRPEPSSVPCV
jgi:hypothetical protein